MKLSKYTWVYGLAITVAIIVIPIIIFMPKTGKTISADPWENVPLRIPHTDHTDIIQGPFETGSDVTRACLECHQESAGEIMSTTHWTWESQPYYIEDREGTVTVGKKNSINNFCIGIQGNWPGCTSCHAGYGWEDANFDFSLEEQTDCLVCHDSTGTYVKGYAGFPVEGVNLLEVAQSVGESTREN